MIKQIVFDCSDTLLRFGAPAQLALRLADPERAARIKAAVHQSRGWNLYDKGLVTDEGLHDEILPLFDEEDRPHAAWYLDNWLKFYTPIAGMPELVKELHENGWPLYILSDFPLCIDELMAQFPALFSLFDGKAVSCQCQVTKGDQGLFGYFLEKYGLQAEKCVFIDDVPRLVDNARSLGFEGVCFTDAATLREKLKQLSVL